MTIRWAVQNNLGGEYAEDIERACNNLGLEFYPFKAIPFSEELPPINHQKATIFYGATRCIDNIYKKGSWKFGTFFNPDSVFTTWNNAYGEFSLNYNAEITTLDELEKRKTLKDKYKNEEAFIRPVSDQKEFAGTIMSLKDIKKWRSMMSGDIEYFAHIPIIVSEVNHLWKEWRCFMVNGKMSSITAYRLCGRPYICRDEYHRVIEFAESMAKKYSPAPVFVIDVGITNNDVVRSNLYVIEIGCFNSAGFYAADVEQIVKDND